MVFFDRHTHGAFGMRLNEILIIWPSEKNHKTSFSGGISTRKSNVSIIKKKIPIKYQRGNFLKVASNGKMHKNKVVSH